MIKQGIRQKNLETEYKILEDALQQKISGQRMRSGSKKRVNQALRKVAAEQAQAQYQMAMIQTPEPRLNQS